MCGSARLCVLRRVFFFRFACGVGAATTHPHPHATHPQQGAHYTEALRAARPASTRPVPGCTASASLHSLADVPRVGGENEDEWDYVFLSPVWPSVSKPGHAGTLPPPPAIAADLAARPPAVPVLALGGLTPVTARDVASLGCAGAAVLGCVWEAADPLAVWAEVVAALDAGHAEQQ